MGGASLRRIKVFSRLLGIWRLHSVIFGCTCCFMRRAQIVHGAVRGAGTMPRRQEQTHPMFR